MDEVFNIGRINTRNNFGADFASALYIATTGILFESLR